MATIAHEQVTKELVRLKKLVLSGGFRFDASNTIDQGESLELVELDGGNSAAMENEADEDLHLASSEELELVQALTALPRADRVSFSCHLCLAKILIDSQFYALEPLDGSACSGQGCSSGQK